jgi:hypothetical protein
VKEFSFWPLQMKRKKGANRKPISRSVSSRSNATKFPMKYCPSRTIIWRFSLVNHPHRHFDDRNVIRLLTVSAVKCRSM